MRIGLIAGEHSGDALGAGLIHALKTQYPAAYFEGIAGPLMSAAGCKVIIPAEALAVMGLVEVLARLPRLLRARRRIIAHFRRYPPDVFIGIDSPDFNLPVETRLRAAGIATLHYVSPSVWAWRPGRVAKVARAARRVLTLLPFEADFYARQGVAATFVGHPLADAVPMHMEQQAARAALALDPAARIIAILPGSRAAELKRLGATFIATARWLVGQRPALKFVLPVASPALRRPLDKLLSEWAGECDIKLINGNARTAMAAADAVLAASGTATLEALLLKRPMVVAYRVAASSAFVARRLRLMRIERFALPNLLAGREIVEEFIQERAEPHLLGAAILRLLDDPERRAELAAEFARWHTKLRRGADERAARAVLEVLRESGQR